MTYVLEHIAQKYSPPEQLEITHDEEFSPTFLNTCAFLFGLISQNTIFWFNYGVFLNSQSYYLTFTRAKHICNHSVKIQSS